jgi:cytochrome c oxidase accessory protein FixG
VALGLPFVSVGGESALRLDVPAGRLHAFGASFAIDEAFVVLAATLAVSFAFLLVTLVLGRAWCGWACPQTVLGDLTALVEPERDARGERRGSRMRLPRSERGFRGGASAASIPPARSARRRPLGFVLVALVSAVVAADLVWWFVSPYEFFARLAAGTLGPVIGGSWAVLFAVLFLDLAFLRADFCATTCPYAKLQGVLFDRSTLVVAYDAGRAADCVDCGACVRVCPTGIDIREGLQAECIACAACIDACTPIMAKLRRRPDLVGYFAGEPGGRLRPLRPAALALAGAMLASVALLVVVVAARALLDLSAVPELAVRPRRTADGRVLNAYSVALGNRGREPLTVTLAVAAPGAEVSVRPERVELGPGERRQVRLVTAARGLAPGVLRAELSAEARRAGAPAERRTQAIALVAPEDGP